MWHWLFSKPTWCWLLGHKPLKLDIFAGVPFLTFGDDGGNLVDVSLCIRCQLLYWEVSHGVNKQGLRATVQKDSVCWN